MAKKTHPVISLIVGVFAGGFGWLMIKNFANKFTLFTTNEQIMIGAVGFLAITYLAKQLNIIPDNPLRK